MQPSTCLVLFGSKPGGITIAAATSSLFLRGWPPIFSFLFFLLRINLRQVHSIESKKKSFCSAPQTKARKKPMPDEHQAPSLNVSSPHPRNPWSSLSSPQKGKDSIKYNALSLLYQCLKELYNKKYEFRKKRHKTQYWFQKLGLVKNVSVANSLDSFEFDNLVLSTNTKLTKMRLILSNKTWLKFKIEADSWF